MSQALEADIVCFQEMKIPKTSLDRSVALAGDFDGFFSFPVSNKGYSGVAVYTNAKTVVPLKAEEGLTGLRQPKPPLGPEERVSDASSYPDAELFDFYPEPPDASTPSSTDFAIIDAEGRALVLDFGLFVLINVYCPAETSDNRLPFKMNFHRLLEARVRGLLNEGREVIVVGDINVCAHPLDHGEGSLASRQKEFWEHPPRAWFKQWLGPEGPMIDAVRRSHPGREGMYTCWSTLLSARESNYGARIDYILITKGLLPWFKHGDIQADVRGSDHCPVYIDLHDEITLPSGEVLTLKHAVQMVDAQGTATAREPPRICARFWNEFSGKQTLLSTFFGKIQPQDASSTSLGIKSTPPAEPRLEPQPQHVQLDTSSQTPDALEPPPSSQRSTTFRGKNKRKESPNNSSQDDPLPSSSKAKKTKITTGQTKLSTFFRKPTKTSKSVANSRAGIKVKDTDGGKTQPVVIEIESDGEENTAGPSASLSKPSTPSSSSAMMTEDEQLEADYLLARSLEEHGDLALSIPPDTSKRKTDPSAWKTLLAPLQPPLCIVHNEPCKRFTVNKPGPNKGKTFYICSRPVGPGYDKGRSERLRSEVNPEYRCDFFKWASDVRKEASRS
ncbi:Class II abasic (AP) endonuclease [Tulasnella sp. 403]|nr:Class II abasic (AP) endonuclease [Tulasnella sp. 403]